MSGRYDDIIHLPHPQSKNHPAMTPWQRGAQFSPFAALTGFDGAVAEEGRLTQSRIELAEDGVEALNESLAALTDRTGETITVTWFCPDSRKAGGSYLTTTGILKKLDPLQQLLTLQSGEAIPFGQILQVDGDLGPVHLPERYVSKREEKNMAF